MELYFLCLILLSLFLRKIAAATDDGVQSQLDINHLTSTTPGGCSADAQEYYSSDTSVSGIYELFINS
jgi:hypothetical protein